MDLGNEAGSTRTQGREEQSQILSEGRQALHTLQEQASAVIHDAPASSRLLGVAHEGHVSGENIEPHNRITAVLNPCNCIPQDRPKKRQE